MNETTPEAPAPDAKRGRRTAVVLGVVLLVAGAIGGATAGWASTGPLYRAQGLVYVTPSLPSPADPGGDGVVPRFEGFVAYQAELLESERVARTALASDVWQGAGAAAGSDDCESFLARRHVERAPGTQHIVLGFADPRPEVALAGLRALLTAYEQLVAELDDSDEKVERARAQVEVLQGKIEAADAQVLALTAAYGGVEGLELRHQAALHHSIQAEQQLEEVRAAIRARQDVETATDALRAVPPLEIALESEPMAELLLQRALLEAEETYAKGRLGAQDEALVKLRHRIGVYDRQIDDMARAWNAARRTKGTSGATLDELKEREQRLAAQRQGLEARTAGIGRTRADVERLQAGRAQLERRSAEFASLLDNLSAQTVGKGRITVADRGALPREPWCDDRPSRALTWGALGALPGLLALLFLGLRGRPA